MQISRRSYNHPDVATLVARLQAEYVLIYGAPDDSPTNASQFEPPAGALASYMTVPHPRQWAGGVSERTAVPN